MKRVTVVGGGFSGLTTAYFLARDGVPVTLIEKQNRLGGMVDTLETPYGIVEAAASGIRSTRRLEELCAELEVPLVATKKESRKRYLVRDGRPRQWPLGFGESLRFAAKLGAHLVTGQFRPRAGETIESWGRRVFGDAATRRILAAALQGIYAGDPSKLSASLIVGKKEKVAKGKMRGLVAPPRGLAQLTRALASKLESMGVEMRLGSTADELTDELTVICTSIRDCSSLLGKRAPELSRALASAEMLPLLRVTAFYPAAENTLPGFGALFPRGEGLRALGVLFNTNIFPDRGEGHSESWIYGGAQDREVLELDDRALFEVVDRDRERLFGRYTAPLARYVQRWPVGLPHYDLTLEKLRRAGLEPPRGVLLAGNYLRGIGLPMLLEQSHAVAADVRAQMA